MAKVATYTITKKGTEESFKALPHTFGNGFVLFAPAEFAGTEKWTAAEEKDLIRFENPDAQGDLTSEVYDIKLDVE